MRGQKVRQLFLERCLALQLRLPIWTEDRDFENLPGVSIYKTAELLMLAGR